MKTKILFIFNTLACIFVFILLFGCGIHYNPTKITLKKKSYIKIVLIEDKDISHIGPVIKHLKKVFSESFYDVSIKQSIPNKIKGDKIIIIPTKINNKLKCINCPTNGETLPIYEKRYKVSFDILYYNRSEKVIISNVSNEITDPGPLAIATLCLLPIAIEYFTDNQALNAIALELHNKILSFKNFDQLSEKAEMSNTSLSNINIKVQFSDKKSIIPNNCIDAGETSIINIELSNVGERKSF